MSLLFPIGDEKGAEFSPCRKWRYTLWRQWNFPEDRPVKSIAFIGLNPSTADEEVEDNTVRRCINFSKDWGFDRYYMLNAYASRDTDPAGMKRAQEPIGEGNDEALARIAASVEMIIGAWGSHCTRERQKAVCEVVGRKIYCLGWTDGGFPRHPLFMPKIACPSLFWSPENGFANPQ